MNSLKLIGGKFYRDGIEIPVKIGDSEQIKLVREHERAINKIGEDGIECTFSAENIRFDAVCEFKCICGARVSKSEKKEIGWASFYDFEEEISEMFDEFKIQCTLCKHEYIIENEKAKSTKLRI